MPDKRRTGYNYTTSAIGLNFQRMRGTIAYSSNSYVIVSLLPRHGSQQDTLEDLFDPALHVNVITHFLAIMWFSCGPRVMPMWIIGSAVGSAVEACFCVKRLKDSTIFTSIGLGSS